MKTFAKAMLALLVGLSMTGTALAGAPEGSWYIAPQLNALWLDDDRLADDDAGVTLAFGRTLNTNWDAQISLFGSEHDRAGNNNSLEIQGFGLSANRIFYREGRVNPFLSLGLARIKTLFKPGADDDTNLAALGGVGLLIGLGTPKDDGSTMQLRADLGARRGLGDNSGIGKAVDYVAGLGIQYSWGGSPARRVVDTDGDGVNDDADQCPGTPAGTPVDSKGCPLPQDDDGDGVTNDIDKCPSTPAGAKVDATGCELDSDGDGVGDSRDQCPNTPAGAKVDEKGCELDTDGDGVVDSQDKCPDTPKGDRVDAIGCSFKDEIKLPGVVFETNKADLLPESIPVLEGAIATLKRYPELNLEVAGHTDSRGSDAYNLDLSARRAETVLKYLHDGGVQNALTSRGYGERQPIASNNTDAGRQANRRVVLRVLN
ncbi:MAG TPA: OmpA family protein [Steroidobacteraceae bacterium]|nr:OmpA family protein [Steroidobacteraceae bacterium]